MRVSRYAPRVKTRRPRSHHRTEDSEATSRPPDLLTTAAGPRTQRGSRCVASSNAAARADAAPAASERKTSHHRREIPDLRHQGTHNRPPSAQLTAGHTLRASEPRNMQQISHHAVSNCLPAQWKHEFLVALSRRRATRTQAVLPHTSPARTVASGRTHTGRVTNHLARAPTLDGGGDEDADTETDTTVPDDDNDDIATFTSQRTTAIETPNL